MSTNFVGRIGGDAAAKRILKDADGGFRTVDDVTSHRGRRFRPAALNERRRIEGEIARLRHERKPYEDAEAAAKVRLERLDGLIIGAWDGGARTADGTLVVEDVKGRLCLSKGMVEDVCAELGVDFQTFLGKCEAKVRGSRKVRTFK